VAVVTRKEILKAYRQGPEAVVTLFFECDDIRERQIEALTARVATLEAALQTVLGKDSHNSSKPPSSDQTHAGRAPKSLRTTSGKRTGGQPGHPGKTLSMRAEADLVVVHAPVSCDDCGHAFSRADLPGTPVPSDRRQVLDLPPTALICTEHRLAERSCPGCGAVSRGAFPLEARTSIQYGPRLLALGVSLTSQYLLPVQRATDLLSLLAGQTVSPATLLNAEQRVLDTIGPSIASIHDLLRSAPAVHFDETGFFVETHRHWLHVACTKLLTEYTAHRKRGTEAHADARILPGYTGTAVHDGYASYFKHTDCRHALCGVHLLRELTFLAEECGANWARKLRRSILVMKRAADRARAKGQIALDRSVVTRYRRRYLKLVADALANEPPPVRRGRRGGPKNTPAGCLLKRLRRDKDAFLLFLSDLSVPFDNSEAERDIRMMKVEQKVSGGFRTMTGAQTFCSLRSYLVTARKHGVGALESLQAALAGQPFMPVPE
jgi:transposase